MKRKQKAVITIETHQLTLVHTRSRKAVRAWCESCAAEVEMVAPEQAASLLGIRPREIYRRVESGALHFVECNDGSLLICCHAL